MLRNYDAQLRIRSVVADFDMYVERYRAWSMQTRRLIRHLADVPYGPSKLECLDIFMPQSGDRGDRPVHVFFHGGYWRAFDKADYSFVAGALAEAGIVTVIANYGLMPGVSMSELVSQCRASIRWVHANAARFGGSPERISLSGHSAGAHIASLLHLTPWLDYGLPHDTIKATVAISGIYDLSPVFHSFLRQETQLTEGDVIAFSLTGPAYCRRASIHPLTLCFGADETAELRRQSEVFASELRNHSAAVALRVVAQRHHMSIVLDLGDGRSDLGKLLLANILSADPLSQPSA